MMQSAPGKSEFQTRATCRSCGGARLLPVLDLGTMPRSDGFLTERQLEWQEPRYPLNVVFCDGCGLMQILETVPPETLFCDEYVYFSSFSDTLLAHARENALELIECQRLGAESLVIELASNDGYLLRNFVEHGIPVLGIDPAPAPALVAEQIGVPTLNTFFTRELAAQLRAEARSADIIIANNVLAHVADTNGFVEGIATVLKSDGVACLEFPYVRDLIDHVEFDTIYHEHLCYFSLHSVAALFRRHALHVNDVRRLPIHGGSLRVYVSAHDDAQDSVRSLLAEERHCGVTEYEYYRRFAERVTRIRNAIVQLLSTLRGQGKRVAAYGAAAKGTILLNSIGANQELIEFVVDRNVHKHGRWVPGARIPIVPTDQLLKRMPDYALILPWNFKNEIVQQQASYLDRGGRFIVPIPEPHILAQRVPDGPDGCPLQI